MFNKKTKKGILIGVLAIDETTISENSKGGVVKLLPMPGADSDKTKEIPLHVPDIKSKVTAFVWIKGEVSYYTKLNLRNLVL